MPLEDLERYHQGIAELRPDLVVFRGIIRDEIN
jgi:hypothetical protein